jgi:hypothetical protein
MVKYNNDLYLKKNQTSGNINRTNFIQYNSTDTNDNVLFYFKIN